MKSAPHMGTRYDDDRSTRASGAGDGEDGYGLAHAVLVYLIALLLTLPLFIIVYPFVPEITLPVGQGLRLDHLLTFTFILVGFVVLVRRFQLAIYVVLIVLMTAITFTGLFGNYGFGDLYRDYAALLHGLRNTTVNVPMAARHLEPFQDGAELRSAIDHLDPHVRDYAVRAATAHFKDAPIGGDEFTMVQCFSIFKEINAHWRYVSDPQGGEYFARASESVGLLAGDCDDHAILMAACIKAIGGEARLVRTSGHIYPEFKVGGNKDLERAAYLIRKELFMREVGEAPLYYHTDADGGIWLNMDYTRSHPGGEVLDESIVGILDV